MRESGNPRTNTESLRPTKVALWNLHAKSYKSCADSIVSSMRLTRRLKLTLWPRYSESYPLITLSLRKLVRLWHSLTCLEHLRRFPLNIIGLSLIFLSLPVMMWRKRSCLLTRSIRWSKFKTLANAFQTSVIWSETKAICQSSQARIWEVKVHLSGK